MHRAPFAHATLTYATEAVPPHTHTLPLPASLWQTSCASQLGKLSLHALCPAEYGTTTSPACPFSLQAALEEVRKERAERAQLGSQPAYTRIYY